MTSYQPPPPSGWQPPPGSQPPAGWQPPPVHDPTMQQPPTGQKPPKPPLTKRRGFRISMAALAGLVVLLIGVAIGGGGSSAKPSAATPGPTVTATATVPGAATTTTATVTAPAPTPTVSVTETIVATPAVAFTDGQFAVPGEVQPGTYHTPGGGQCYLATLRDLTGGTDSILNNDIFNGPATVQVPASAAGVESRGGCSWSKVG